MRTLLLSTLALGALTAVATAEPFTLMDNQMDKVTAGDAHEPFFVHGAAQNVTPGSQGKEPPATFLGKSQGGSPDAVVTPGAATAVFPGISRHCCH
jgi:hypothetical protein